MTPAENATTEALLLAAAATAVLFVAVILIEGARRPGYDPVYHTGSELELGARGWVQRANFFVMGGGAFAFAAGLHRTLGTTVGAILLAVFGFGMIVAGMFAPDPIRGYPPGAPSEPSARFTWQATLHAVVGGPIAFFALFGACLTVVGRLHGSWQTYTAFTAAVGLGLTIWTARSFRKDAANLGIVQRGLIGVYWSWIVLLSTHLITSDFRPELAG